MYELSTVKPDSNSHHARARAEDLARLGIEHALVGITATRIHGLFQFVGFFQSVSVAYQQP